MDGPAYDKTYRLAALDPDFILGDSMRGARFMMEYAKAEEHLRNNRIRSTIVVFGSARAHEEGEGWRSRAYAGARSLDGSPPSAAAPCARTMAGGTM